MPLELKWEDTSSDAGEEIGTYTIGHAHDGWWVKLERGRIGRLVDSGLWSVMHAKGEAQKDFNQHYKVTP